MNYAAMLFTFFKKIFKEVSPVTVSIIFIILFTVIGIGSAIYTQKKDGPVEEYSEEIIADGIEDLLILPDDSIDIDLTPGSPEDPKES